MVKLYPYIGRKGVFATSYNVQNTSREKYLRECDKREEQSSQ